MRLNNFAKGHFFKPSDKQKLAISMANKGKHVTQETKDKLRISSSKFRHSIEVRLKMSISRKGKPAHNKGIPMSQEQKDKISFTKLRKIFNKSL